MPAMHIERELASKLAKSKKSVLLLGPRQTGKSTLIQHLHPDLLINLADEQTYLDFARNPAEIKTRLSGQKIKSVFVDEVQRLPSLLNTIQSIIDSGSAPKFFFSGSSARKLKRGKANLLPGRIHVYYLNPLSFSELGNQFRLQQSLETGTLPGIYLETSREEQIKTLKSYSATYLKEEIQTEALARNIEGFSRFLFTTAQCSGQFTDLTKLASEAQIARQSATRYLEILEDTLTIHCCPPFSKSSRRRLVQHPKFYFFDTGVLNALLGNFHASEDRKGMLFEHFFFNQMIALAQNRDQEFRISAYRTEHGAEVDFIVELEGEIWAIELKASRNVGKTDLKGLNSFAEFFKKSHRAAVAYWGEVEKKIGDISIVPWQKLFSQMFFA